MGGTGAVQWRKIVVDFYNISCGSELQCNTVQRFGHTVHYNEVQCLCITLEWIHVGGGGGS